MSVCHSRAQLQQEIGSIPSEKLAIVPDIQTYTIGADYLVGCKRFSSDSLEEGLDLLEFEQFQETKRHCGGNGISPSPNQIHFVDSSSSSSNSSTATEIFAPDVKESYIFGIEEADIFTATAQCGGNSPASDSSSPGISFTPVSSGVHGPAAADSQHHQHQQQQQQQQLLDFPNFFPGMQQQSQVVLNPAPRTEKYELIITEQPEEYYRARYNSEGVRAPLKGMTENYPTVRVCGPDLRYGRIDVKLVHEDGTLHTSCSLDTSEGRKNAVSKKIGPFNHMVAEFEDLRIRRVKKEGRKKSTTVEKTAPKDGRSDKVASLLFTATLETEQGELVQSIQSRPISLTTAPEPAELDWLEPNRGHFAGQEPLVIKGSKMTSPKVSFRIALPDGRRQELHGSVDKERSHQNVLLVKTPSLAQIAYQFSHQTIRAEVVVITGRNQMSSNALHFDFIPNHICRECMQETRPAHLTAAGYSVCSPAYPTASTTASGGAGPGAGASTAGSGSGGSSSAAGGGAGAGAGGGGGGSVAHSPPPTPGLSAQQQQQQAPASPNTQVPPSHIHLAPAQTYSPSIPSTPLSITSDTAAAGMTPPSALPPAPGPAPSHAHAHHQVKSGDDIMVIMRDLMGQDCSGSAGASSGMGVGVAMSMHVDKDMDTPYLYAAPPAYIEGGVQQAVASPYIPVTSPPSAASDQPCYSPVTPVQSPANSSPWNYIEQMLASLLQSDQINHQDYRFLADECVKQNPVLRQAFLNSQRNEGVFLQLLASYKPETTYQATRQ